MKNLLFLITSFVVGVLAAMRPFWNVGDPAIEAVDKFICPFYNLAPVFPNVPGSGDDLFFRLAYVSNGLLYVIVASAVAAWARHRRHTQ
jgi:hypothetical protein